jgi:hypothetical protein
MSSIWTPSSTRCRVERNSLHGARDCQLSSGEAHGRDFCTHVKAGENTSFLDEAFLKNLESALRFGTPLLIQDVEHLDPILNAACMERGIVS